MTHLPLRIHDIHLTPTEAIVEIWPFLSDAPATLQDLPVPGQPNPGIEYRGKLVGPRCRYAATIEVAYPFPKARGITSEIRVVVPEPNFWDPVSPFLYHGTLEAWENGQLKTTVRFTHGLRSLRLGPPGFRLNGKPATLQAATRSLPFDDDLLQLRRDGFNALVVPNDVEGFATVGDELGFLIIRRITTENHAREWGENPFQTWPSSFGFLLSQELLRDPAFVALLPHTRDALHSKETTPPYWGIELQSMPTESLPAGVSFAACTPDLLPQVRTLGLPLLVLGTADQTNEPNVFGAIRP